MLVLFLTISIFLPFYVSMAAVSIIAFMTVINYERRAEAFGDPYSIGIVLFFLFTGFVGQVYNNHIGSAYSLFAAALLVCGFYIRSFMTKQLYDQAMDTACLSSVACAAVAIFQKISTYATNPSFRPISTFINANYYATIIEFVVLIAIYRMITNAQNRRFYMIVIASNLVGLYLSASMSAIFSLGLAVLVFLFLKGKRKMATMIALGGMLLVVFGLILPELFPRIEFIDQSWDQRVNIWTTSIKGIQHHPFFGEGAAAYRLACEEYFGYKTYHAHNLYLDTLLNFGLVGATVITGYVYVQARIVLARFRGRICGNMNVLLAACSCAVLVHGFTDVTIFWGQTAMLFLLIFSSTGINAVYAGGILRVRQRLAAATGYLEQSNQGAAVFKN
ncbi:O-antigen ligase family protein [Faecalispora anaeroviscerum]|uniref:O-antigen ligase family protein n=1 Tax=Faecalispora anaeroviscerum TaxID=2991836 RepID=UPI0024B9D365|nr:O-antigen ligase family protein [Faecalispora anaeroviscerum]